MNTPRLGVVGIGPWSETFHVPAALASARVELTAVLGRDPARTAMLAGADRAETDLGKFLNRVDLVAFAVPPAVQARIAPLVARAGKHLLLEKPVALDPVAAAAVRRAIEEAEVRSVMFLPHLLAHASAAWLDRVQLQGGWRFARLEQWSSLLLRDPANPFAASAWRLERGGLWDVGPHAIAQLCRSLGPVLSVSAQRGRGDLVAMHLEHAGGAVSELVVAADLPADAARSLPLRLVGEAGTVESPAHDWKDLIADAHDKALTMLTDSGPETPDVGVRLGEHLTAVLDGAERSIRSGNVKVLRV